MAFITRNGKCTDHKGAAFESGVKSHAEGVHAAQSRAGAGTAVGGYPDTFGVRVFYGADDGDAYVREVTNDKAAADRIRDAVKSGATDEELAAMQAEQPAKNDHSLEWAVAEQLDKPCQDGGGSYPAGSWIVKPKGRGKRAFVQTDSEFKDEWRSATEKELAAREKELAAQEGDKPTPQKTPAKAKGKAEKPTTPAAA